MKPPSTMELLDRWRLRYPQAVDEFAGFDDYLEANATYQLIDGGSLVRVLVPTDVPLKTAVTLLLKIAAQLDQMPESKRPHQWLAKHADDPCPF